MIANQKLRFYPKQILRKSTGTLLTYDELLTSPCYFDMASTHYESDIEYLNLTEEEMLLALEEFFFLATKPNTNWMEYTPYQLDFKKKLHPLHLDLFYIPGVPCDIYLQRTTKMGKASSN